MSKQTKKSAKKAKQKIYRGVVHIQTGYNNTIVTITNIKGDAICWSSAGASGLKGKRRSTAYAAKLAAANAKSGIPHNGARGSSIKKSSLFALLFYKKSQGLFYKKKKKHTFIMAINGAPWPWGKNKLFINGAP
jgi:hypothetical protein